ncbi:unnamed protein product [Caenorhabditis auriculariae]|uniref:Serpentine receptor class gamma n=1 Tax=Caenorhabditis auriculariae TaxID=2777116 RepID=A0A8S1GTU1_9PELO|nr:unnamed protein product [Caenorhabditis auriculariae]
MAETLSAEYSYRWIEIVTGKMLIYLLSIFFYVYVLLRLACSREKHFRSTYFMIYMWTGVFDVLLALATVYDTANFAVGFGPKWDWLLTILKNLTGTNWYTHLWGGLLMSTNQYLAIAFPGYFPMFFTRRKTALYLLIGFLLSQLINIELYFIPFKWVVQPDGFQLYSGRTQRISYIRTVSVCITMMCTAANILLNAMTLYTLREKTRAEIRKRIQEKSLVVFQILNSILIFIEVAYEVLSITGYLLADNIISKFIYTQFPSFFFLMAVLNSFAMVILSRNVRVAIGLKFLARPTEGSNVGPEVTSTMGGQTRGQLRTTCRDRDASPTRRGS